MRGLFITATDTGAGKTFATAVIARTLRARGTVVRVCKPVATGAERIDGRWISDDTRILAEAADDADFEAITPWTFPTPAAPPVAARLAGVTLRLDDLAAAVRRRAAPDALVLVEGVGGLLCPLTERETVADLAADLGLPLVVVARRSLGTLNHTLLTLEVAEARGLPAVGIVVSETTAATGTAEETNVDELRRRVRAPILAVLRHRPDGLPRECAEAAAVDWARLAGGVRERNREPSPGGAVYPS
jgi:dethiobiotin synthetase